MRARDERAAVYLKGYCAALADLARMGIETEIKELSDDLGKTRAELLAAGVERADADAIFKAVAACS